MSQYSMRSACIWRDFGALTDDERGQLLPCIYRALKPGGVFLFDVFTLQFLRGCAESCHWSLQPQGGFWHPDLYLELQRSFLYAEADSRLDQHLILTVEHGVTAYHLWNRTFSPEGIGTLLATVISR